ncbi:unnamed protein product [Absidia cylindrospora]
MGNSFLSYRVEMWSRRLLALHQTQSLEKYCLGLLWVELGWHTTRYFMVCVAHNKKHERHAVPPLPATTAQAVQSPPSMDNSAVIGKGLLRLTPMALVNLNAFMSNGVPLTSTVAVDSHDHFGQSVGLLRIGLGMLEDRLKQERDLRRNAHKYRLEKRDSLQYGSLSSILLVTPGCLHKDLQQILGGDGVNSLQSYLAARFGSDDDEFSANLATEVVSIQKVTV